MSEARFTPGPWGFSIESIDPEWAVVTTWGGSIIANVNADYNQEANAALIAAAPAMYEALTALHAFVGVMVGRGPECVIPETLDTPIGAPVKIGQIMRDAAAALSRAGGK